jgi:hypothetical protein
MRLKVIPCVNSDQSKKTSAQYEWIFISQWQSASHPAAAKPNAAVQNYVPQCSFGRTKAMGEND